VSDVDAVIELLERWRDATGMGRMRIGIDATRTIAGLPVERKRALAIEVAERVAPQLVPAIESESGDLTTQQVGAVVDLLRRADREQLDDLVTALRSGEVMEAIDLVDDAVSVVAPPDEATDELLEDIATEDTVAPPLSDGADSPDAPSGPPPADDAEDGTPAPRSTDRRPGDGGVSGAGVSGAGVSGAGVSGAGVSGAAVAASAVGDDEEIAVADDGSLELDEDAVRERMRVEAAERAERYRDTSRDVPDQPAYQAPEVDFTTEDLDLPDPEVESVAPLHERMDRRSGAASRRLAASPVTQVVASVTATADGYRRRRAALQAIRDGRLAAEDVAPIVRSFDRATDRSWVAGAALDAGLVGAGSLDEFDLSPAAVARLRRRVR
jgi:hypothetical protein